MSELWLDLASGVSDKGFATQSVSVTFLFSHFPNSYCFPTPGVMYLPVRIQPILTPMFSFCGVVMLKLSVLLFGSHALK